MDLRKWWPHADSRTIGQPRYCISCESYFETMTLLLFGGPSSSLANRFGLRRGQLPFYLGCCTLRTFATETAGNSTTFECGTGAACSKVTELVFAVGSRLGSHDS